MQVKKAIYIFSLLLGINSVALASLKDETCSDSGYKFSDKNIAFAQSGSLPKQRVYILHNKSPKQTVLLNKAIQGQPAASAGWSSSLAPKHWSALAMADELQLNCGVMENGTLRYLDCQKVLKVCTLTNAKVPQTAQGSYWISENQPKFKVLLQQIQQRGLTVQ